MWIDLGFTIPLKAFKYKIQYRREVAKTTKRNIGLKTLENPIHKCFLG